jgi:hypothetical protein
MAEAGTEVIYFKDTGSDHAPRNRDNHQKLEKYRK